MLIINQLTRLSAEEIGARIALDGKPLEFTVRISHDGSIRTCNLEGLSRALKWELSHRDECRALLKAVCVFADGASVALPKERSFRTYQGMIGKLPTG
jgi:hypothetical protein